MTSLMRGQLLGKHFRHHGKMPLGINVFNKDLKQRLISLCSSIYGRMAGAGPLFSINFTTLKQSIEHGIDNLQVICQTISKELPGSWLNIDHAYLYGNNLQSLPIYYSTHNKNDVKQLNFPLKDHNEQTQLDELSTHEKNLNDIVQPNGIIHLTRRKKLSNNVKKKKPIKRLYKTWTKGLQKQKHISTKVKSKKENMITNIKPQLLDRLVSGLLYQTHTMYYYMLTHTMLLLYDDPYNVTTSVTTVLLLYNDSYNVTTI